MAMIEIKVVFWVQKEKALTLGGPELAKGRWWHLSWV